MDKRAFIKVYNKISILVGITLFAVMIYFINTFPTQYYGNVTKSFFKISFDNLPETAAVFNLPLILLIIFFLMNVLVLLSVLLRDEEQKTVLLEVPIYNTLFTFLMLIAHIFYTAVIPNVINGTIKHTFFTSTFPKLSDVLVTGINFVYVLTVVYIIYNLYIFFKYLEKKEIIDDHLYDGVEYSEDEIKEELND
ncbi:MAG: hypothetical protein K9L74_01075 [Candidatus Izimaplasma sp.]|nr:hypothetical protein [Candidatus Izimaplasma bacterium]